MLHANSYTELWSKTVSPKTAWMPNTACFTFTWLCCAMYTIIIRDMLRSLLLAIGMAEAWTSKESVCAMMVLLLLPLCLLRSLSSLAYTSFFGMLGCLYTTGFAIYRHVKGDYAKGGRFFQLLALERRPKFGDEINISKLLVLISYFHGCYQVHFDAPKFFHSLSPSTLRRFNVLTYSSFTIAGLVGAGLMIAGFLTFGEHSESLLLNNYHSNDQLATWARLATLVSILCSYPLFFGGFASGIIELTADILRSSDRQTVKVEGVHFYSCLPPLPRLLRAPCSPPSDGSLLRWLSLTDNRTFWRL
mmetsp:Transcript_40506/g.127552  ORF Transcript_40506/g.127552 Transcript_40506/m.127552 type:complete len:304 (-) Transcript_40506:449-1360(-)